MANNIIEASEKLNKVMDYLKKSSLVKHQEILVALHNLSEAKDLLESDEHIFIQWSTQDIIHEGATKDIEVTEKQAKAILQDMKHRHDATIGINWDVINVYLDQINDYEK